MAAHQLVNRYLTGIVSVRIDTTPLELKSLIAKDMVWMGNGMLFGMDEKNPARGRAGGKS
ncbi:hypothetical protein GTP41_06055 [Pseudoduganella sp. DS3]|uniref:Uncharacterized protein n=1 Tax=Pseudoduganella guangdongensis TaxID=2692179 RepID=A0A6N9HE51_9BURK|nr:hypothetical protein [Pseudoduganella guangdongensis]MYN01659.1 hypothetical protein [Pseudoduganella guangdongensis]